jgi:hypothetical protein
MPEENITPWIKDGRRFGYPECCVQMFSHLASHGLPVALVLDYFYGKDSCREYVRCPKCRDKHETTSKVPMDTIKKWKSSYNRDWALRALGGLEVSINVVRCLNLLPCL